jgi:hypothetical protein
MRGVVKHALAVGGPSTQSDDFMRLRWLMCIRSPAYSEDGSQGRHYRQRSKDNDRRQSNGFTAGYEFMVIGAAFDPIEVTPMQSTPAGL